MTRDALLYDVAARILGLRRSHPLRVGIDGVDASGKTTFANALADVLREQTPRTVIRASIDGFHNPRAIRIARGKDSPEGYYRDSFNHAELVDLLLRPLGQGGDRVIRRQVFDFLTDAPVDAMPEIAPDDAILIFEGVFLLRPELRPFWDYPIFLNVPFEETVARAAKRDTYLFGDEAAVQARYAARYVPGQRLYFADANPKAHAALVIDNTDVDRPVITYAAVAG